MIRTKIILIVMLYAMQTEICIAQGFNHTFLLGFTNMLDTFTTSTKGRINFDLYSDTIIGEQRKMAFREVQSNICNANGNFLFASNGCWIMDATGDTMLNGNELNPGLWADSYCSNSSGIAGTNANLIIPFPGDSNKFVLFHQIGNFFANLRSTEVFYTVIDISLNGGLGGVIPGQKNLIAFSDTLSWGLAACKHANGRDWWIVALRDSSNTLFKILFTPNGIASIDSQNVSMPIPSWGNAGQPCFSPDGTKFAYKNGYTTVGAFQDVRILSFNRCSGNFDSLGYAIRYNEYGFGLSFSPNSRFLYYSSNVRIYQIDTDAPSISSTDTLVATYDGYFYPNSSHKTMFWLMYLAANGKIYITSDNAVLDLNIINFPDSVDASCDVQQHSLHLPCYIIGQGINHPNYYLGCDTTLGCGCITGVNENEQHDFRFRIYPNPVTSNSLHIGYLLPQTKSGLFQIYDVNGKVVFKYTLPQWSNEQELRLPLLANGIYNATIISNNNRVSKTIAIINE